MTGMFLHRSSDATALVAELASRLGGTRPDPFVMEVVVTPHPHLRRWLVNEQLFIFPFLLRKFPELRAFFYRRYFYDRAQAYFLAAAAGLGLSAFHPAWLVAGLPYAWLRGSQPTVTLRGPLRPLRVPTYFARDAISFVVLVIGSVRFRSVLL